MLLAGVSTNNYTDRQHKEQPQQSDAGTQQTSSGEQDMSSESSRPALSRQSSQSSVRSSRPRVPLQQHTYGNWQQGQEQQQQDRQQSAPLPVQLPPKQQDEKGPCMLQESDADDREAVMKPIRRVCSPEGEGSSTMAAAEAPLMHEQGPCSSYASDDSGDASSQEQKAGRQRTRGTIDLDLRDATDDELLLGLEELSPLQGGPVAGGEDVLRESWVADGAARAAEEGGVMRLKGGRWVPEEEDDWLYGDELVGCGSDDHEGSGCHSSWEQQVEHQDQQHLEVVKCKPGRKELCRGRQCFVSTSSSSCGTSKSSMESGALPDSRQTPSTCQWTAYQHQQQVSSCSYQCDGAMHVSGLACLSFGGQTLHTSWQQQQQQEQQIHQQQLAVDEGSSKGIKHCILRLRGGAAMSSSSSSENEDEDFGSHSKLGPGSSKPKTSKTKHSLKDYLAKARARGFLGAAAKQDSSSSSSGGSSSCSSSTSSSDGEGGGARKVQKSTTTAVVGSISSIEKKLPVRGEQQQKHQQREKEQQGQQDWQQQQLLQGKGQEEEHEVNSTSYQQRGSQLAVTGSSSSSDSSQYSICIQTGSGAGAGLSAQVCCFFQPQAVCYVFCSVREPGRLPVKGGVVICGI